MVHCVAMGKFVYKCKNEQHSCAACGALSGLRNSAGIPRVLCSTAGMYGWKETPLSELILCDGWIVILL